LGFAAGCSQGLDAVPSLRVSIAPQKFTMGTSKCGCNLRIGLANGERPTGDATVVACN
jgi:hypothetical protein